MVQSADVQSKASEPVVDGWGIGESLIGFARACRAAGLPVVADRERAFLCACAVVGLDNPRAVYWAGRATLTGSQADVMPYDQVFAGWFGGGPHRAVEHEELHPTSTVQAPLGDLDPPEGDDESSEDILRAAASYTEVLRHRDVAELSAADRAQLNRLLASLRPRTPMRAARRHRPIHFGKVDGRATVRTQLRNLGEPARIHFRRKGVRPRRVVLLIDVSGSMSAYADALLRLAHTVVQNAPRSTEAFAVGTRLTHITRALRERDVGRALMAIGDVVPDWSGGARLGESLAAFLQRWGRRGMARGAVVVVFSDGWEREKPEFLGKQMRSLRSLAHHVVWVNPHRGKEGYQPLQAGIVASLPHIDDFVAGHSLTAFQDALDTVARA